ncbi:MAG: caspase family protein, partial [Pirellulales bacterium]
MTLLPTPRTVAANRSRGIRRLLLLALSIGMLAAVGTPTGAARAALPKNDIHRYALLIGAAKYQKWPQLRYTVNDCQQLQTTLTERGGYAPWQTTLVTDDSPYVNPTRKVVMEQLQNVLG